jgi:hypothetical protein
MAYQSNDQPDLSTFLLHFFCTLNDIDHPLALAFATAISLALAVYLLISLILPLFLLSPLLLVQTTPLRMGERERARASALEKEAASRYLSWPCCLFSAVCSLLSVVFCLLSIVCCLFSAVYSLLSVVFCLLSIVCCLRARASAMEKEAASR